MSFGCDFFSSILAINPLTRLNGVLELCTVARFPVGASGGAGDGAGTVGGAAGGLVVPSFFTPTICFSVV